MKDWHVSSEHISKELSSTDPELYKPRDSRELVMQNLLADLDFAIEHLPSEKSLYTVTKWTALALKSRACLFEGTFRKYHDITIDGGKDWQWYLQECADASYEFIASSGYSIYTVGGTAAAYRNLFVSVDAAQCRSQFKLSHYECFIRKARHHP